MAGHKGKGAKGREFDELSGIGTSQAGTTGTTGNLNSGKHDGGVGMPPRTDSGNRQNADLGEHGDVPALGNRGRANASRQSSQADAPAPGKPDKQSGKRSR